MRVNNKGSDQTAWMHWLICALILPRNEVQFIASALPVYLVGCIRYHYNDVPNTKINKAKSRYAYIVSFISSLSYMLHGKYDTGMCKMR